jgi:large subunit ribosomal protein L7Ae
MAEVSKEVVEKVYEAIETAKSSGKLKKGTNEVTKAVERGTAKLVAFAKDANPPEITMHIPIISKEKGVPCVQVDSKEELGAAAGLNVPTVAVAVVSEGDAKKIIKELASQVKE